MSIETTELKYRIGDEYLLVLDIRGAHEIAEKGKIDAKLFANIPLPVLAEKFALDSIIFMVCYI
jgi:hypothetical protein